MRILAATVLVGVCLVMASCSGSSEKGLLQGIVSIGPLSPVEQPGQDYQVPCEVYEARKILVYKQNGKDLLETLDIDCDGRYRAELTPGTYVLDINHTGVDFSSEVPAEVTITSNVTTRLDIDIDTGIR